MRGHTGGEEIHEFSLYASSFWTSHDEHTAGLNQRLMDPMISVLIGVTHLTGSPKKPTLLSSPAGTYQQHLSPQQSMALLNREDPKVAQFMSCVFPVPLCVCDACLQLPIQQQRSLPTCSAPSMRGKLASLARRTLRPPDRAKCAYSTI